MSIYPTLKAEMKKNKVNQGKIAKSLGLSQATVSYKMNGNRLWTLEEALTVKQTVGTRLSVEELFSRG